MSVRSSVLSARRETPEGSGPADRTNGAASVRRSWMAAIAVLVVYVAAGKLGLRFALDYPSASPVWPPTGIAIAAILLWGRPILPVIFLGAFVVNATTAGTIPTSLGIAVGNTAEAALGAYLTNRFAGGAKVFSEPQYVFRFSTLAGLLATCVSASVGVGSLLLGNQLDAPHLPSVWLTWWMGDVAGALLVTPLIVVWCRPRLIFRRSLPGLSETLAVVVASVVLPVLAFSGLLPPGFAYVGASVLAWTAFRLGPRATVAATALWSAIAVAGTIHGNGPFVRPSLNESLLLLQTYMAFLAVTALVMSAAVEQRSHIADTLEATVRSRTRELEAANERLTRDARERELLERERERRVEEQAARREAERLNRQKDEFLATVSHELRTPLSAVLGWAELLRNSTLDEPSRVRAIDTILRNTRLQVRLISDMLDVSRIITHGKLDLKLQTMDPAAVVRAAIDQLKPEAEKKGLALRYAQESPTRPTLGDPERLGQALSNIISNAVKFTDANGTIEVAIRQCDLIEIDIADTGPGIDPEFHPFLFDRFSQVDRSNTRRHGGLGLGLAIARHIVELHGGTIEADNHTDRGALFKVRIPTVPPNAPAVVPEEAQPEDGLAPPQLEGISLLVVDDDESARGITAAILERSGAQVRESDSSESGIQRLAHETFQVLIVDLAMPGEDGYGFLSRARALRPRIPALALTAHATATEETKARTAGFDAFLSKPVDPRALVRMVSSLAVRNSLG